MKLFLLNNHGLMCSGTILWLLDNEVIFSSIILCLPDPTVRYD